MENPDSDLFFPRYLEIKNLPQREQHWIWVLVGSTIVEKVGSPPWASISEHGLHATDEAPTEALQPTVPIETALTFRFGFHLETILDAIITGMEKTNASSNTCMCIAEFVGPSRFFCFV